MTAAQHKTEAKRPAKTPERPVQAAEPAVSELTEGLPLLARPGLAGMPNHPSARPLFRASAAQLQRRVGNHALQRQPDSRSIQRDDLPEPIKEEETYINYSVGADFTYRLRDNIQLHLGMSYPLHLFIMLEPGMLDHYSPGQIAEMSLALLESQTGLVFVENKRQENFQSIVDRLEQWDRNATARQSMRTSFYRAEFEPAKWSVFNSRIRGQLDARYPGRDLSFSDDLIASMNLPKPGRDGKDDDKGEGDSRSEKPTQPKRPNWTRKQEQRVKKLIEEARKQERPPAYLPDRLVVWHNRRDGQWYMNVWVNLDTRGREKTHYPLRLDPNEQPEQLYERVQAAAHQALLRMEDQEKRAQERVMPPWARRLKSDLEQRIAQVRREDGDARNLPDGLALVFGTQKQQITQTGAGADAARQPKPPEILLQVWVQRTSGAEVKRNSGIIPWPLSPQTTVDGLLKAVREKAAILREWEREPIFQQPPAPRQDGQPEEKKEMLRAFPAEIVPVDLRGDRITVTGADNEFGMQLNYEAVYGGGELKDLYIASRLSRERIWFRWSLYRVPDDAAITKEPLPADWGQRSKWLYDHYNNSERSQPPILGELIPQGDSSSFDLSPAGAVTLKQNPHEVTEDAKERIKFPAQPGDFLVVCQTLHAPLGDYELLRAPSVAYYPVRTKTAQDLAGGVVHEAPRKIEALKKQMKDPDLEEDKKKALQAQVLEIEQQEKQLLPEMTAARLADVQKKLKDLRELERIVAKETHLEGSRTQDPLAMRLPNNLLELWSMAGGREMGLHPLRKTLLAQEKELKAVTGRIKEFSSGFKAGSPNQFRPVVTLVSEVTGQTYDMLMMLGEVPIEQPKSYMGTTVSGPKVRYKLADVTTSQTQKDYFGESNKDGEEGHNEAIQDALETFGRKNSYGEGTFLVRIPRRSDTGYHPKIDEEYRSEPGTWEKVKKWLGYLAAAAGIAALILGSIATGGALGAVVTGLGVVAGVGGAVMAVENIRERQAAHRLSLDAELILDIVSIAGPALQAFSTIPRIGARLSRMSSLDEIGGVRVHPRWVAGVAFSQKFMYVYGAGEWAGTAVLTSVKMMQDLERIDKMLARGEITKDQAEKMRGMVILEALQSGAMLTVQVHQLSKAPDPFKTDPYVSWVDKGWIDPSTGRVTEDAPPFLQQAAEKARAAGTEVEAPVRTTEGAPAPKPADIPAKAPAKSPVKAPAPSEPEGKRPSVPAEKPVEAPRQPAGEQPARGPETPVPKPAPEPARSQAAESGLHAATTTEDGQHKLGVTEDGLVRCTSCDLLRRTYRAALEEPANQNLRKALDRLEEAAKKAVGKPKAEEQVRERERKLEARLAAAVNQYLDAHLTQAQRQRIQEAKLDPPRVMNLLKNGVAADEIVKQAPRIVAQQKLDDFLLRMVENNVRPEDLGYNRKTWEQLARDYEADPQKAWADLNARIDRHGVRSRLTEGPPAEADPFRQIPDTPERPLDLPEYQEAIEAGRRALRNLREPGMEGERGTLTEQRKTRANIEGGTQRRSGYKPTKRYPDVGEASERALVEGHEAGRAPAEHGFDRSASAGEAGIVRGSHAEKQAAVMSPDTPVAVDRRMCPDCRAWFQARAVERGTPQIVVDPRGAYVFMPDGRIIFDRHPIAMYGPGGTPRGGGSGGRGSGGGGGGSRPRQAAPARSAPEAAPPQGIRGQKPTADGKHKVGLNEEGEPVRCSSCDLMRRTFDAALEEYPPLRQELDDLTADSWAAADDAARNAILLREVRLEERLATATDNYLATRINTEQMDMLHARQVDPPAVMRALRGGMAPDDVALLGGYHGSPAVELAGRLVTSGVDADDAVLNVLGVLSVPGTGRANLELVAARFEGGNRASVTGNVDYAHELPQAMDYVNRQPGGGEFRFAGSYGQGIEGEFLPAGARPDQAVPVSLKVFTTESPRKVFDEANKNASKILKLPAVGAGKAELFAYTTVTRKDIQAYFEGQPAGTSSALEVFKKMTFVCSDGVVTWDPSAGWR